MMKININSYKNINLKFALFVLRLSRKAFKIAINVVSDEEKNEQSEAKRKMEIGKRKKTQKRRTICAMQIRLNCDYTGSMCIRIAYVQGAILQEPKALRGMRKYRNTYYICMYMRNFYTPE